jgi:hypothetical protein
MSLYEAKSGWLSLGSKVWFEGRALLTRTAWLLRVLSLGTFDRVVAVDPIRREVSVRTRRLWFFTSEEVIPFDRIAFLDYRFSRLPTSFAGVPGYATTADQLESFRIELVLDDEREVRVGTFVGEGSRMNGLGGVLFGDSVVDFAGTQEDRSRDLVEELSAMLGVPLGRPLLAAPRAPAWTCIDCGRGFPFDQGRCLYCGSRLQAAARSRGAASRVARCRGDRTPASP